MVVESGVEVDGVGDHEGASSRRLESGVVVQVEARSPSTPYIMVTVEDHPGSAFIPSCFSRSTGLASPTNSTAAQMLNTTLNKGSIIIPPIMADEIHRFSVKNVLPPACFLAHSLRIVS